VGTFVPDMSKAAPAAIDWMSQGVLTKVKDQGACRHTFAELLHGGRAVPRDTLPSHTAVLPLTAGQCGSCWSFSAAAAMESAYNRANNVTVAKACAGTTCGPKKRPCCAFSEQELVDCVQSGADTCDAGGEMHDAYIEVGDSAPPAHTDCTPPASRRETLPPPAAQTNCAPPACRS
jgi:C1A family cysteine protease